MPGHTLDSVTIDGFRGLRNLRLDGLGRINLLVGENNSGKTSVLEAISILAAPYDPLAWIEMVGRRAYNGLDETLVQSLRWCFTQSGGLADIDAMFEGTSRMACSGSFPAQIVTTQYRDIDGIPTIEELDRDTLFRARRLARQAVKDGSRGIDISGKLNVSGPHRGAEITQTVDLNSPPAFSTSIRVWESQKFFRYRNKIEKKAFVSETLTPYSYQINEHQVKYRSSSLFSRRRDAVLALVHDFDPEVQGVEIGSFRGERPAIYLDHRRLGPAPLSIFGDAMRRAVLLASVLLTLEGGGVLLIDEIETGIHVGALGRVFAWLGRAARDYNVQVIATTHSLEAVDAISKATQDDPDELATFRLVQTEDETRAKRIDGELLMLLRRERGLDVR